MTFEEKIKNHVYPSKEEFQKIYTQNLNRQEICLYYNISASTYKKLRKYYNLPYKQRKVNKDNYVGRGEKIRATWDKKYGIKGSEERQAFNKLRAHKTKQTCLKQYGVASPGWDEQSIQKRRATNLHNFGVDNPMKCSEVQNKVKATDLQRYGTEYHIASEQVQTKVKNTILEKYGVTSTAKLPEVTSKRAKTNLDRYGFACCLANPEIRKKGFETMAANGVNAVLASSQQLYINNLFHGELNYLFGYYHIDSYLQKDNIGIEYSGGGHNLSVKTGRTTEEYFKKQQEARKHYFMNHCLPILEFVSLKDRLPSDKMLIKYYQEAKEYFLTGGLYYCVNLDTHEINYE